MQPAFIVTLLLGARAELLLFLSSGAFK